MGGKSGLESGATSLSEVLTVVGLLWTLLELSRALLRVLWLLPLLLKTVSVELEFTSGLMLDRNPIGLFLNSVFRGGCDNDVNDCDLGIPPIVRSPPTLKPFRV